jgi:adenosylmethionine-8-amino-7-oxononanoate aminotransferase
LLLNAFHGDTFTTMAASGISFIQSFSGMFIDVVQFGFPVKGRRTGKDYDALQSVIKSKVLLLYMNFSTKTAGMVTSQALDNLMQFVKSEQGCHYYCDEVMTDLAKPEKICNRLFVEKPDMMCLSKALTGGTILWQSRRLQDYLMLFL